MLSFIRKHNIIYKLQFGFREGHSTSHALIDLTDRIRQELDNNGFAIGVFLDIKKAFDCINHHILTDKLEHYGFRGHSLQFLQSYYTDRSQYTCINTTHSGLSKTTCGVPQGSTLGPLLFLIFINDINECIKHHVPANDTNVQIRLFADDTSIIICNKNLTDLLTKTRQIVSLLNSWYNTNKLQLNFKKSNYIIFHKKGKHKEVSELPNSISIGNDHIQKVNETKYIGITIDQHLSWTSHVNNICRSLAKYFGIYYNIRNYITNNLARTIYYSTIYPLISYAIEVYGTATSTYITKIQTMQNKLLRILTKKNRLYSTDKLHTELNILKVKDVYKKAILGFVYSCVMEDPIPAFTTYYSTQHNRYNTRNANDLTTFRSKTNWGQTTIHSTGARLWNSLPSEAKKTNSKYAFRKLLQNQYIELYQSLA
jgi:hypothetical protein